MNNQEQALADYSSIITKKIYDGLVSLGFDPTIIDASLIGRNCMAGFIYKFFNAKFNSPTIGLYMDFLDFYIFVKNLASYLSGTIEAGPDFITCLTGYLVSADKNLPKIKLYFLHYSSLQEAIDAWTRRTSRVNLNNIIIINAVTNQYDAELLESAIEKNKNLIADFNALPYKQVTITYKTFGFKNEIIIPELYNYNKIRDKLLAEEKK